MFSFFQSVRCVCSAEIPRCRYFLSSPPPLLSPSQSPDISFGISTNLSDRQHRNRHAICKRVKKSCVKLPDKLRGRTRLLFPLVLRAWFCRDARLTTYQYYVPRLIKWSFASTSHAPLWVMNSVALVRTRTIPTERPPPVGEVSANFCG